MSTGCQRSRRQRLGLAIVGSTVAAAMLAACATGGSSGGDGSGKGKYGFAEASQKAGSAITVWIDSTRSPAVAAFKKANPGVAINVVTYDGSANGSNSFKAKMGLFDRAGSGWPDVVFSSQNNDSAWASQSTAGAKPFAAPLNDGLIPQSTLAGFSSGALNTCTVDGKVYCLRNDLAQVVLWYNKTLLDKFGYAVPTTWQQYQELGAKVAAQHPGYITGSVGDPWAPEIYLWGSKCQAKDVTGVRSVTVNTATPQCRRAADLMDAGVKNGSLTKSGLFTPEFTKTYAGKVLMLPGPARYAGAIFNNKASLNVPKGQLGVAAPLKWGSEPAVTGNVGGGTWFVSSHSKNLAAAKKFVEFVTTADQYQVALAPGYPAYGPAAKKWVAAQQSSGYYATSLSALATAASQVWSGWGAGEFSQEAIWAKTVAPLITSGQSIAANLSTWQTAIEDQAKVQGYSVK